MYGTVLVDEAEKVCGANKRTNVSEKDNEWWNSEVRPTSPLRPFDDINFFIFTERKVYKRQITARDRARAVGGATSGPRPAASIVFIFINSS
ncbi:hypothetical protein EVAR_41775_1 [Eumeta japonica]|uniref:Uncharacterized protein n=1 Tax=Eumeta variegata TaxID=151549 RepID=A0A4C1VY13_EUMVA|nr:hypothetical protein EVAR_41775_1 [Eumeta japonica]